MNIGDVVVALKLQAQEFVQGAKSAAGAWEGLSGTMLSGGLALSAAVTAPLVGVGTAAMSMASQLQSAEIGFTTMLGSAEKAGEFLEELKDFAAKTPFEFKDLVSASQRMMALGFEAKQVVPTMTAIGNAAAGLGGGAELINRITLALGQMGAKGKVSAEEMRQLAEAGIPAWKMLADAIGVSIPEAMKMAEKGAIQASEAIPAIVAGMTDKFGGLMENFSTTVMGRWSNLKDSMGYILADIGKSLMPLANSILENVVIPVTELLKSLVAGFAALPDPIKFFIVGLAALAAAIGPVLLALGGMAQGILAIAPLLGTAGIAATLTALGPILAGVAAAIAAVAAAWALWQLEPVQNAVKGLWDILTNFWSNTLKPFLETVYNLGSAFVSMAASIIGTGLEVYWAGLKLAIAGLVEAGTWLADKLSELWDWLSSAASVFQPFWDFLVAVAEAVGVLALALTAGAFVMAYETFKLLTDAFRLQWEAAKVLGAVLWDVLIAAFNASIQPIKALWNILGPMLGAALDAAISQFKTVSNVLSTIVTPVVNAVTDALKWLLDKLMQLPGVKQVVEGVSGAFTSLKDKVSDAMKGAAGDVEKLNPTLVTLKGNVDAAQKTYNDLFARMEKGEKVSGELQQAQVKLAAATSSFNDAIKASGISVDGAQKKVSSAITVYQNARKVYEDLKKSYDGTAKSTQALELAQDNVAKSAADLKTAQNELKLATNLLGKEVEATTGFKKKAVSSSDQLKDADKKLKAEVENLTLAYKEAIRTNDGTEASLKRITDAQTKLQEASDRLHPEAAAERAAKGWEEAEKRYATQQKEWEKLIADVIKLNEETVKQQQAAAKQAQDTATDFAKAYEDMRKATVEPIKITVKLDKQVTAEMKELLDDTREYDEAIKKLGITTSAQLSKSVAEAEKAYDVILEQYHKGRTGAYELLQAEREVLEARAAAAKAAGQEMSDAEEDRLEEINKQLEKYGEKQVGFWQKMGQQVSTIINDFAKDISQGLIDLVTGGSRGEHNAKLEEQQADLQKSLDERTAEWEAYQAEIASQWAEAQAEYAKDLQEDLTELQDNLAERVEAYTEAEAETQQKLEAIRTDNASRLAGELADLREALDDKRKEYEVYASEVTAGLAEIRKEHADELAEELADLQDSLNDKRKAYQEYVQETVKDLNRLYQDYNENISDETRDTERGIADKQKAYNRYVEDTAAKLQELKDAGEADSQDAEELKRNLQRKKEDLDEYITRAKEDLDEYTSDQQRRMQREEADLKESLQKRQDALNEYLVEQTTKRDKLVAGNQASLAKEEADLLASFQKRTASWEKYKQDNADKAEEVRLKYATSLAKEEADLQASLDKKKKALDDYTAEVNKKREAALLKYEENLDKEAAKLQKNLSDKQQEYDKFVEETNAKIAEIGEGFRTVGDDIKGFLTGALEAAGMALARFVTESLIGELIGAIKGPVYEAFKWLGGEVAEIFKGIASFIGGLFGVGSDVAGAVIPNASAYPTMPGVDVPSYPGASPIGSAGQAAGSGLGSIVGVISGAVSAISGVVSNFQQFGMNKSLDLIERETRYSQIHLGYILEKLNDYLPGLRVLVDDIFYGQLLGESGVYGRLLSISEDIKERVGLIDQMPPILHDISSAMDRIGDSFAALERGLGGEGAIALGLDTANAWLSSAHGKLESIADFTYQTTTKFENIYARLGDIDKDLYNGPLLKSMDKAVDYLRTVASNTSANKTPPQVNVTVNATTNASPVAIGAAVAAALRTQGVRS